MSEPVVFSGEWDREVGRPEFHSFLGRKYTTHVFPHPFTGRNEIINDVQAPTCLEGWSNPISVTEQEHDDLELIEDLRTAETVALDFVKVYSK